MARENKIVTDDAVRIHPTLKPETYAKLGEIVDKVEKFIYKSDVIEEGIELIHKEYIRNQDNEIHN